MIPRTKVNYKLSHLLKALFIAERSKDYKGHLISLLQNYLGEKHILLTPSGRGSLYFILKAIDKPRVLVPAYTCKVVIEAATLAGKEVIYVEVEDKGFNITASALENLVDKQSAVIATHQFGIPCEIEKIVDLCRDRQALVIEDVAAALGSRVNGKLVGTFGDAAFYSFDSTKLITVPMKGGFLTAKDPILFDRIKSVYHREIKKMPWLHKIKLLAQAAILIVLENHLLYRLFHKLMFESRGRFTTDTTSMNLELNEFYQYELTNWQACIAADQFALIDKIIRTRQIRYSQFMEKLNGCQAFELPPDDKSSEWACIRFPIRAKGDKIAYYNNAVKRGVDFAFSFTFIACPDSFKNAKHLADSVLDIPFYVKLRDDEVDQVISVLKAMESDVSNEY